MNLFYIGLPAWIICSIGAYGLREHAIRRLAAECIGTATPEQRRDRIKFWALAIGTLLVYLALRFGVPNQQNLWLLLALAAFFWISTYFSVRDLRIFVLLLPRGKARILVIAEVMSLIGLFFLFGAMAMTVL